jgi:hypothetical protein
MSSVRWRSGRALCAACVALATTVDARAGEGRTSKCLRNERGVADAELSYGPRGDRCEGVFVAPVSGAVGMVLVGFQLEPPAFDLDRDPDVPLRVAGEPFGRDLSLQVRSVVWRVYYQMDTSAMGPRGVYRWSTEVIRRPQLRLGPDQIAALACTERCRDSSTTEFYPVQVGAGTNEAPRNATIVLQSTAELSQIRLTVFHGGRQIVRDQAVGGSSFPPDRPIRLALERWLQPGANEVSLIGIERLSREAAASLRVRLVMPTP